MHGAQIIFYGTAVMYSGQALGYNNLFYSFAVRFSLAFLTRFALSLAPFAWLKFLLSVYAAAWKILK